MHPCRRGGASRPSFRFRVSRPPLALLLSVVFPVVVAPGAAQEPQCPQGRISYVFIDNRSIFDLSELDPETPFLWAYRVANALHIRTREDFIRKELLFHPGECLDTLLLSETGRLLRSYRFIGQADVFALRQPDGSQHVNVYTQDEWTTKINARLRLDGGLRFNGLEIAEENLLGRGMLARVFLNQDREQQDVGVEFQTPRLFRTRWDGRLAVGTTRSGNFFEENLLYPFLGEVGRFGARESIQWRESLFAYAIPGSGKRTHLLVPFLEEHLDLAAGVRFGRPGHLTVLGGGLTRDVIRFRDFPGGVEYVLNGDFSTTEPADQAGIDAVAPQLLSRRSTQVHVFVGQRNLHFLERRGLDALRGVQDVKTGVEAFFGAGRGFRWTREGGGLSVDDLHVSAFLFAGAARDRWTVNTQLRWEGRRDLRDGSSRGGWRDVVAEGDAYFYVQPQGSGYLTLLTRISATGGWSATVPFQLTLGGQQGVRGYREDRFPGSRRILFTVESRHYLSWPAPQLFDFGLSAFADAGIMGAGSAPFGVDSGWKAAIGAGIRFGLPPGTANVARVDLALPLTHRLQLRDIILRISLQEVLGLIAGIRDQELLGGFGGSDRTSPADFSY